MIIDSHLHLDDRIEGPPNFAVEELSKQLEISNIQKAVVIHLENQRWSKEEFIDSINKNEKLIGFVNINPNNENALNDLEYSIKDLNFKGLKLHPRLQNFNINSKEVNELVKYAGELKIPVLIDTFPDGSSLYKGFNVKDFAEVAIKNQKTKFIWAHCGGHYVIDFMMVAKRLDNIFMDISYSLLYYLQSNISYNIIYAMKSMKFEKIMYGSDYPDRSIKETLDKTQKYLIEQKLSKEQINKILFENANNFFNWKSI